LARFLPGNGNPLTCVDFKLAGLAYRRLDRSKTMPQEEVRYYQARVEDERALARSAPHPEAARAHTGLADLYLDRLRSAGTGSPGAG
jgi:hypothetical protein